MTVSSGAAGKAMVMFISNICRRSTEGQMEIRSAHSRFSTYRRCNQSKPHPNINPGWLGQSLMVCGRSWRTFSLCMSPPPPTPTPNVTSVDVNVVFSASALRKPKLVWIIL